MTAKSALIIDHDDSFIWNIKTWLQPEFKVTILNHSKITDLSTAAEDYDLIIMSPGPKSPRDYPHSLNFLKTIRKPVLGICLGFQMMTEISGGEVVAYSPPYHGKSSRLTSSGLSVGRYHSLKCIPSEKFKILAESQDDQCVMWAEHLTEKKMGFQFHPESFLTELSEHYKKYILDWMS